MFQWNWPQMIYMMYRLAVAIYIMCWLIYSIYFMPEFNGHVWPAFLTNWSYTVLACYLIVAAVVVIRRTTPAAMSRPAPLSMNHPELAPSPLGNLAIDLKTEWCLFAVISNFAFIITFIYFAVLYPHIYAPGQKIRAVDFHIHGFNSVVIIIEMMICAFPIRLLHAIYPMIYGLTYVLFSIIYWAFDHKNNVVYKNVLDWNKPGQTIGVILGLGFLVIPILQLALFGLYRLRVWIYDLIQGRGLGY